MLKFSRNISIDREVGDIQRIVWAVVNWGRIPATSFRTTSQCLSIHKSKAGQKYTNRAIQKSTYPKNRTLWPIQLPICLQEPIVCTIVVNCQHLWTITVCMVPVHWAQCMVLVHWAQCMVLVHWAQWSQWRKSEWNVEDSCLDCFPHLEGGEAGTPGRKVGSASTRANTKTSTNKWRYKYKYKYKYKCKTLRTGAPPIEEVSRIRWDADNRTLALAHRW